MSQGTSNGGGWQNGLAMIGGAVAAFYGYHQAQMSEVTPLIGALYFGLGGMFLVRVGLFIARTALVASIYSGACFLAVLVFRGKFIELTGIDPIAWLMT